MHDGVLCMQCAADADQAAHYAAFRGVLVLDTETELMVPGKMAPELVVVGWANANGYGLVHHTEARPCIQAALESDLILVGHHIAYDAVVFAAKWPDLLPLIFEVYEADRISDTLLREKLCHIAQGQRAFKYGLDTVAKSRLGVTVDKKDEWRLRFGELKPYPIEQWPEGAVRYAQLDPVVTLGIYQEQEVDQQWLADQYRQARAALWLQLMSVWGICADAAGVRAFAAKIQKKYDDIARDLLEAGLLRWEGKKRPKLVRNTKVAKERMEWAWSVRKGDAEPERKKTGISLNADNCDRSGDELLEKYAELSSLTTIKSTYIPLLEQGIYAPMHTEYDSLKATGRTGSSSDDEGRGGNVQNLPTDLGTRECFVPRPGKVYAVSDFGTMELHCWGQVCFKLFGFSDMVVALNNGVDPHTKMASLMLNISYEEAIADYRQDPKGRVYKPRQSAKVANFGYPGGLGVTRFVDFARKNYGVIVDEKLARDLKRYWKTAWREATRYADWVAAQGKSGSIQIEQMFVNRFRGGLSYTEGSNSLFQGLAADAAKRAGFAIARSCYVDRSSVLFGSRPVIFAHDEFVLEVDDDYYAHDRAMELARIMKTEADVYLPDCPAVADPLLARRWSKAAKAIYGPDGRLIPWDMVA